MTAEAPSAPESAAVIASGPSTRADGVSPVTEQPDGTSGHPREEWCPRNGVWMRIWFPTWAVMGPSTTDSEIAQAWLDGLLEEDQ